MYKQLTVKNKAFVEPKSAYQPGKKERDVTAMVQADWQTGKQNQTRTRPEFNDRSILTEIDVNQKAFNSYVPPKSDDPDLSWRAQTVRPITRNKLISIAAHVTATVLYPNVFAQNTNDDEDRDAAQVMRDLIEWVIDNSNYTKSFLSAVVSMLVDPFVVVEVEYCEVMRKVKVMTEEGKWTEKEILDEILSGFATHVVPAKQILFANFYEPDIQKQRFIIREKYIDHADAKLVHGRHANFKYVKPGVLCIFDENTKIFYDVIDDDMAGQFDLEVTYWNRTEDLKLTFLNGILMCDPEYPNPRNDKKYPFAHGGFEPLGNGQCFCFKSAANKLGSDQDVVDTLYNMIIDGGFLSLMPPMALYGSEDVDSSVMIPGMITSFRDKDVKMESIAPRIDLRAGLETIATVERSMSESGGDPSRGGNAQGGERTAREVLLLEKNAQIALGLTGKMVRFLVEAIGDLLIGDILQYMTVGEVSEISDNLKFRTFTLPNKNLKGRSVTKKIEFIHPGVYPDVSTEDKKLKQSFNVMREEGGFKADKKIAKVNPEVFRTWRYKARVSADEMNPPSKALEKALNLELYDRAIQNPLSDQEAVTRDFLFETYRPGDGDKYMKKMQPAPTEPAPAEGADAQKGVNTSMLSQITGSNSLDSAASAEFPNMK